MNGVPPKRVRRVGPSPHKRQRPIEARKLPSAAPSRALRGVPPKRVRRVGPSPHKRSGNDGDVQEDALVFHPPDAVEDRPEVDRVEARLWWRLDLEREAPGRAGATVASVCTAGRVV